MSSDLVVFEGVWKAFDHGQPVIKDLNLSVREGEFLTLLGPSGSGKTTTLMMLAGFEEPTAGTIRVRDRSLSNLPPHRRGFGIVFQDYSLFPHLSVARNVAFPLAVRRRPRAEIQAAVARMLKLVRLDDLAHRKPSQLSGGQQQRVALARALAFAPPMVLMDEPLGALDKQLREQLQLEIRGIQRRLGTTAVYVTHDQHEALTMSDRVAVFHEGRIRQIGTPEDLYERPQSIFVARFIGESNVLEGRVTGLGEETCSVALDYGLAVKARMVDRLAVGERCALSLRPESITAALPSDSGDNLFTAPVTDIVYQGDHRRVQLTLSARTELFLKIFAEPGRARLKVGDHATFRWSAGDCLAFRAA